MLLKGTARIPTYEIWCVVKVHSIKKRPEFYYQGTVKGSPAQYSPAFITWLLKEYEKDNDFFKKTRQKARQKGG